MYNFLRPRSRQYTHRINRLSFAGGLLMILFFLTNIASAQSDCDFPGVEGLVISEVSAEGSIEIYNGSDDAVDLAEYYLYTSPAYRQIEDLVLDCGATLLEPGDVLAVSPLAGP